MKTKYLMRNFSAREKERAIVEWQDLGGGARNARIVAKRHLTSKTSLYRWFGGYDGTVASLTNNPKTPRSIWNKYTLIELETVRATVAKYPNADRAELLGRLQTERAFSKGIRTLYRMLRILNVVPVEILKQYKPKFYETPTMCGVKWQIGVKYVPSHCLYRAPHRMYQYTCIDERTRKRFMKIYHEYSALTSIDFVENCILYFGYKPLIVQTDNGSEFTNTRTDYRLNRVYKAREHAFTEFLNSQGIEHKRIAPATPRHNGKVERSHRTDNQCFYAFNTFNNIADANAKLKEWLYVYNNIRRHSALGYKSPQDVEDALRQELIANQCKVTYIDIERIQGIGVRHIERHGTIRFIKQDVARAQRIYY